MKIIRVLLVLLSLVFLLDHLPYLRGAESSSRVRRRRERIQDILEFPSHAAAVNDLNRLGFSAAQIAEILRRHVIIRELPEIPEEELVREDNRQTFTTGNEVYRILGAERHREFEIMEMLRHQQIVPTGVEPEAHIVEPHPPERQASLQRLDSFRSDLFTEDENGGESSALDSDSDVEPLRRPPRANPRNIRTIRPQQAPEHARIQEPSTSGTQPRNPNARRGRARGRAHEEPVISSQLRSLRIGNDADDSVGAPSTARLPRDRDWRHFLPRISRGRNQKK